MIRVTLKRSTIGFDKRQGRTARALGLRRIGSSAVHAESPAIMGMIRKIPHLVEVERLQEPVEEQAK
jgi:large subunit ribosomal protein L30